MTALRKPDYLDKGTLMHKMLYLYYRLMKDKCPFDERVSRSVEYGMLIYPDLELANESLDESIYQFREYCNYYKNENWRPIEFERPFSVPLYEDNDLLILYEGLIDLISEVPDAGEQIVDHKTQKRNVEMEDLSNQFMGYSWVMGVPRVVVNRIGFQKTLQPKDRFKRQIMSYTKTRLEEWRTNTIWWIKFLVILAKTNTFPMNFTSCDKYGGCFYRAICRTDARMRSWEIDRHYKSKPVWEPAKELENA